VKPNYIDYFIGRKGKMRLHLVQSLGFVFVLHAPCACFILLHLIMTTRTVATPFQINQLKIKISILTTSNSRKVINLEVLKFPIKTKSLICFSAKWMNKLILYFVIWSLTVSVASCNIRMTLNWKTVLSSRYELEWLDKLVEHKKKNINL